MSTTTPSLSLHSLLFQSFRRYYLHSSILDFTISSNRTFIRSITPSSNSIYLNSFDITETILLHVVLLYSSTSPAFRLPFNLPPIHNIPSHHFISPLAAQPFFAFAGLGVQALRSPLPIPLSPLPLPALHLPLSSPVPVAAPLAVPAAHARHATVRTGNRGAASSRPGRQRSHSHPRM